MKNILIILWIGLFFGISDVYAENVGTAVETRKPFQTYNQYYYDGSVLKESAYDKLAGVTGNVVRVEEGAKDKLVLLLELDNISKKLWIAVIPRSAKGKIMIGDVIDVLGYFDRNSSAPELVAELNQQAEYMLAMCLNIRKNGMPVYYPHSLSECVNWESGILDMVSP
ncbi:MAG: hypothetical protein GJ680_19645 [Alteromonadaceae bacterium]|nr:hypothetical protein [Alteromonadaceae bacterium]